MKLNPCFNSIILKKRRKKRKKTNSL